MKKHTALLFLLIMSGGLALHATRLVEVRTVDREYLMVVFTDGEALFREDASGPSGYMGHDFADGDDSIVYFGEALDVKAAQLPGSWIIRSMDDERYGENGKSPEVVYRKSKVWETTHDWQYAYRHTLFLKLPLSLGQGANYVLDIAPQTNTDTLRMDFCFDAFKNLSEALHVNMNAYVPDGPVKSADLYLWMGDGGQRDYHSFEGNKVWLLDVKNGDRHEAGSVAFWLSKDTKAEAHGRNLCGSDVWNVDFSSFSEPGTYRLVVEGVGCSRNFEIAPDAFYAPYKYSVRGYYYMRIGEDRPDMVPVPRRPTFIPGKDPEGFTIYLTDLHPFHPAWKEHRGDTWDEPHFKPASESMFWKHRLPGNPTTLTPKGGHSDALDWDRHLAHVSNIYDLLLPYLISGGKIADDDLDIGESGNGIPDIMDEAKNEVDFFLSLKTEHGYGHGLTNPSEERNIMFQAGATTMAAWANASNCAMMAEAFRIFGQEDLQDYYMEEAIKAFDFASGQEEQQLDDRQGTGDDVMRGRDFKMMAAAYLYNLSGDKKWEDIMALESVVREGPEWIIKGRKWNQSWATAAYLFTPQERHYPELFSAMQAAVRDQALEDNVVHMDQRPSRRTSNNNYWQTPHNLQMVILAHAISDDASEKKLLEKAMLLEADWGLGRNPSNTVEMTGLGERHIVNCYTSGRNDGTPGLHPGQTPYHNLDAWGGTHNGSHPEWYTQKCYPSWENGWPHQEGHFNSRYSWANAEFTPRQTMRGKMALYGYLLGIYREAALTP